MKIYLISFGKLKTAGLRQTADYYKKIIQPWVTLEEIELKPVTVSEKSAHARNLILQQEEKILLDHLSSKLKSRGLFFILDEKGKPRPSTKWAEDIQTLELQGIPAIAYCIGSSLGFSPEFKKKAKDSISLGTHTMSHELARVVLLEQVYRAYSIRNSHPYHNGDMR